MSLRHAEIVAIGSELASGEKLDTNSQWLSLALAEIGIPVRYHTTMADELDAMVEVLRAAALRSDLVLVTGVDCRGGIPHSNKTNFLWDRLSLDVAARSRHVGGVHALYCDGHVGFASEKIDQAAWRALGTRSGGEPAGQAE
jgi:prepilin-type processing-associated H-X9-DG protein